MADILLPGTAGLPDVLAGKTCTSSAGYKFTGTMTNNGAITITPSNVSQAIPQGYHTGGGSVAAVVVPVANVLSGTTIAGQAGTMVNNGAGGTVTPGTANQTRAAGFWSSLITILGDVALIAANIMTGKTIFGVAGTATADATAGAGDLVNGKTAYVNGVKVTGSGANAKRYATGSATSASNVYTVTGLAFQPKRIIVEGTYNGTISRASYNVDALASGNNGWIYYSTGSTPNSVTWAINSSGFVVNSLTNGSYTYWAYE